MAEVKPEKKTQYTGDAAPILPASHFGAGAGDGFFTEDVFIRCEDMVDDQYNAYVKLEGENPNHNYVKSLQYQLEKLKRGQSGIAGSTYVTSEQIDNMFVPCNESTTAVVPTQTETQTPETPTEGEGA